MKGCDVTDAATRFENTKRSWAARSEYAALPRVDWTKCLGEKGSTFSSIWCYNSEDGVNARVDEEDRENHECNQTNHNTSYTFNDGNIIDNQDEELAWIVNHTRDIHVAPPTRKYFALPPFLEPQQDSLLQLPTLAPSNNAEDNSLSPLEPPRAQKKRKANTIWWPGDWKCSRCGNHVQHSRSMCFDV
ncbi:hypothetical protein, variant 1, partial [Aphanomyces invadans]